IVDGIHLADETAQVVWRAAAGRVALVTDAVTAAGLSEGSFSFGDLDISVHEGAVRGPDGVLAGSVLTMLEAVRNLHGLGAPLVDAVGAATAVPASVLGLEHVGRLACGGPADVVVLSDRVEIEPVMITSSPCFQFTGVETLCFAVSCSESITRSTSSKLRPVDIG